MTAPGTVITAMEVRDVRLRTSEHLAGSDAEPRTRLLRRVRGPADRCRRGATTFAFSIATADVRTYANLLLTIGVRSNY
jgi:hypothetical protein